MAEANTTCLRVYNRKFVTNQGRTIIDYVAILDISDFSLFSDLPGLGEPSPAEDDVTKT